MTHNQLCNIYIASCSMQGGIYHYHLLSDGQLKFISKTDMDRPMYMAVEDDKMYVLLRAPYTKNNESALIIYDIDESGNLIKLSENISTKGEVACHLTVKDGIVYCVNYISGSVIKMPDTLVTHTGRGVNLIRQDSPHPHFAGFTPDGKYICVTDLGLDTIFIYTPDMAFFSKAFVPEGHGVRHLVFSDDGNYCFAANELLSTVSSFSYKNGELIYIETIDIIPEKFIYKSTASAIRYSDGKIYISNRGHNSISVIEHNDGNMRCIETIDCGGDFPRDFDVIGDFLIITNEKSNSVAAINKNTQKIAYEVKGIESPICIVKI